MHSDVSAAALVERAIQRFLNLRDERRLVSNEKAVESYTKQKNRVKNVALLSAELLHYLAEYISETQSNPVELGVLDTLPGLLLLRCGGDPRNLLNPYPSFDDTALNDSASIAWSEAVGQLINLNSVSERWLARDSGKLKEKVKSELNDLIMELYGAVYHMLMLNRPKLDDWNKRPSAPAGPLCRLTEIVLEEIGVAASNVPQLVRRALEYDRRHIDGIGRHADAWQTHIEQQCAFDACPFCSDRVDADT